MPLEGRKEGKKGERPHDRNSWTLAWWVKMTSEGNCRAFPEIWTDLQGRDWELAT